VLDSITQRILLLVVWLICAKITPLIPRSVINIQRKAQKWFHFEVSGRQALQNGCLKRSPEM